MREESTRARLFARRYKGSTEIIYRKAELPNRCDATRTPVGVFYTAMRKKLRDKDSSPGGGCKIRRDISGRSLFVWLRLCCGELSLPLPPDLWLLSVTIFFTRARRKRWWCESHMSGASYVNEGFSGEFGVTVFPRWGSDDISLHVITPIKWSLMSKRYQIRRSASLVSRWDDTALSSVFPCNLSYDRLISKTPSHGSDGDISQHLARKDLSLAVY